ncbi:MAG: hypothetical protein WC876_03990 [Candidatus Thermoplasmatota archaeon]|jgi:hypothetical protein
MAKGDGEKGTANGAEDGPLPEELGVPTFSHPIPLGDIRPEDVPPAGPGETPDRQDDTSGVNLDTLVWLRAAKAILLAEAFKRDPLRQARKPGMVWGVVRQEPDDMQIHVRAFKDGRLETEVELSNRYVQHLWSHRRSAHVEVKEILAKHGMPTERVSETFLPITGTKPGKKMPIGRTKTTSLIAVGVVAVAVLVGWRFLKRTVLKRMD